MHGGPIRSIDMYWMYNFFSAMTKGLINSDVVLFQAWIVAFMAGLFMTRFRLES